MDAQQPHILWFEQVNATDIGRVGGKNASLGEMFQNLTTHGIKVPDGFATTAFAYRQFWDDNKLHEPVNAQIAALRHGTKTLSAVGHNIRMMIEKSTFSDRFNNAIGDSYVELCRRVGHDDAAVAVRSSATAEDLPHASFAGQQESFLNISGSQALLEACKRCFASLYTDRAISYREQKGFEHHDVALSVGIQLMVRSDLAGAGVAFTLDTETGFPDVVTITAAWGLGETVVQGIVNPDDYMVYKPLLDDGNYVPIIEKRLGRKEKMMVYGSSPKNITKLRKTAAEQRQSFVLNDQEILQLARWCTVIEKHYGRAMDIEWAKDGQTHELFIVQARPETVQSQQQAGILTTYKLLEKGSILVQGLSIGESVVSAPICIIEDVKDIDKFVDGAILVTTVTHPDWVPIMKRASGIITELGGRTSHAAIVSRELEVPAIVGATDATTLLKDGQIVTLSCAQGATGYVYEGALKFDTHHIDIADIPPTQTRIMMNIASPDAAFHWWKLPVHGIGLARMEFIIEQMIKIHPMALLYPEKIESGNTRRKIEKLVAHYTDPTSYFVDILAQGIGKIAASQYPEPVIVRMSDFKTNEYAALIGGKDFEPHEENPMLGFRGAVRYYENKYRPAFELECKAVKKARDKMGLKNIIIMIPFCRTITEADRVLDVCGQNGLRSGDDGLEIYVMCEIPSNVILASEFATRFDGFSIGSNDLTQLILGVDRDSSALGHLFDERDEAVKTMIRDVIVAAHESGKKVGICGQAPSDHIDFATFLIDAGIDSISVNPDSVLKVKTAIAHYENQALYGA